MDPSEERCYPLPMCPHATANALKLGGAQSALLKPRSKNKHGIASPQRSPSKSRNGPPPPGLDGNGSDALTGVRVNTCSHAYARPTRGGDHDARLVRERVTLTITS